MSEPERWAIAVVGGATAGAEAAGVFAEHGILVTVFEQNPRPYGKIEDGLPRWHVELRRKEYATIDAKLTAPGVHFVPLTRLGRDVGLRELIDDWGFHSVVLANGAWRDRPLPIEGAERYVGRGLVYQNPFIHWFNHSCEASYDGPRYEALDGTIVVGGGLASIDVVKVLQLEGTRSALAARGIRVDLVEMETHGIPETLEQHGLAWPDLGLRGATLFYRRRPEDMPLVELPEGAADKQVDKVQKSRLRVLEKATAKYLFRVEPLAAPVGLLVEQDRLAGLRFARTAMEGGRLVTTEQTFEARGAQVISSIGSIPEPLPDVAARGELYDFSDRELGRLAAWPTLFSVGNVVTGKGNIVASRKHARRVSTAMVEKYLGLVEELKRRPPLTTEQEKALLARVAERQARVGYDGDYRGWLRKVTPPDLV
jgi:NADPH-dependent glutamate synthase beta subunit-like oxidoreductase